MQKKKTLSKPIKGMNRDSHLSQQQNMEYSFMYNGDIGNETGENFNVQNEPSNYLGVIFPDTYKVIGFVSNIIKNRTYYFLTSTTTDEESVDFKRSSIGYVDNTLLETTNLDILEECEDCSKHNVLSVPLELQDQLPTQVYVELVHDRCVSLSNIEEQGLNFNINFPIKKVEIKQEKLGTTLYWSDGKNPMRYLNVSDVSYLFTQEVPCDDPQEVDCPLLNKLLILPKFRRLKITPTVIQTGGNLKLGTYEFYVVYCDLLGREITGYFTPTQPVKIFDENNNVLSQTEGDIFTNFAIKLKVEGLDAKNFKYYKVVCVERNNVNNQQTAFVEGIHPTTDETIVYTHSGSSSDDFITTGNTSIKRRIDFNTLNAIKPRYETAKGSMVSDKRLWFNGLIVEEELNLQPVVNLFSGLAKWQTVIASEDLYKDGVACSKYVGYQRDEVQPFSIRFLFDDGGYTGNFPFISRPANEYDLEVVDDKNYQSLLANSPQCTDCEGNECRDKRWQVHNTAQITETCYTEENGQTVIETETKTCKIEGVNIITDSPIEINLESEFTTLEEYVNDNYEQIIDPTSPFYIPTLSPYLLIGAYPDDHCTPNFGLILTNGSLIVGTTYLINRLEAGDDFSNVGFTSEGTPFIATEILPNSWTNSTEVLQETFCDLPPILVEENSFVEISEVLNEQIIKTPKDIEDYDRFQTSTNTCRPYTYNSEGNFERDSDFEINYLIRCIQGAYVRDMTNIPNIKCQTSADVINTVGLPTNIPSYYHNYIGAPTVAELLETKDATAGGIYFSNKLHKNALWFKVEKNGRDKIILDVLPLKSFEASDDITVVQDSRFTIYKSCSTNTPARPSTFYDASIGHIEEIDVTTYPNTFYIAVDNPIVETTYAQSWIPHQPDFIESNFCPSPRGCCSDFATRYRTAPQNGCFSIVTRTEEYSKVEVSFTSITLDKVEEYTTDCTYSIPKVEDCKVKPYKKGIFSYWESTVEYPDNKQLYDSSTLKIKPSNLDNLTESEKTEFEQYYTNGTDIDGNFILKNADFRCTNIRHPKFPDNTLVPFMSDNAGSQKFSESTIFPMGITLDNQVVVTMLKVAKDNNFLSQKQHDSIIGYEILKGDNSVHKSVIASGLGFDMYKYEKQNETWHYSNFPFNDLGDDKFHLTEKGGSLIQHPNNGKKNHLFSFISPDVFLTKPTLPTELVMQGFQFGNSSSKVIEKKDHPKWTVLGDKARRNATRLAILEFALEVAMNTANLIKEGSAGCTVNFGWVAAAATYGVAQGISVLTRVGKYRYDWLKIFRDLGRMDNFANVTLAEGRYNRFLKSEILNEDYKRALTVKKYIKDGMWTTVDKNDGSVIRVNNDLREHSVLLSTGVDYELEYPQEYIYNDNNKVNSKSSRFLASEIGCKKDTNSTRDIASPYFTLKNYIPDQWDTVDSIKWLTTNSIFNISENTNCKIDKTIFGGTVYISRFTWRRKLPFFRNTAMGLPDKLPFMYSEHSNIGFTRFYCDYEVGGTYDEFFIPFPDINSDKAFDCPTGYNEYYVKPPSKFYLESHSIVDFLVESEINCNFRYGKKEKKDLFHPYFGNFATYIEEVPIQEPNTFYYNNSYSFPVSNTPYKFLDYTYDKEVWRKRNIQPNAVIYSEKDSNENDLTDPYLVFKPLNWNEYKTSLGKLIDLKDIESMQFLARFENGLILNNAIDNLADRITPQNREVGTAGIFAERPLEFKTTDLGFAGTQNTEICSTPYGHFWVDAKRGKIFQLDQNGKNLEVISEAVQGQPTNMKQWFREHLPFKILKYIPKLEIDNKFKGIGINMWYDDRFDRLFITKRDYVLQQGINKNDFFFDEQTLKLYYQEEEIYFDDTSVFKDVSWTISYRQNEGSWVSYYSFKPDYSPYHNGYFQVGYNWGENSETLWNHTLNNTSFQVFQGQLEPFIVEYPIQNENVNKVLETLQLNIEARRYQSYWDYAIHKGIGFNLLNVSNATNNSGWLRLNEQKRPQDQKNYPVNNSDKTQDILYSSVEDKHNINYFFNRVVNQDNNIPLWLWDKNRIMKEVNPLAISFTKKGVQERLRGEAFSVRLVNDKESRFNILLKNSINKEDLYE